MSRVEGFVNSFTGGEIGPEGWERTDLQPHARGCSEALNLIVLKTGPLASRGGFLDRGGVKDPTRATVVRGFRRSAEDGLFLELGDGYGRVWSTNGVAVMDGPTPYEFVTPWSSSDLDLLWFRQIGDVIFVTRRDGGSVQVIKRLSLDDWAVEPFYFREGPFLPENGDSTSTLAIDGGAVTGSGVQMFSSPGGLTFSTDVVGRLVRLRANDGHPGYDTWVSKTDYAGGATVQYDGRVYERGAGATGKSGTTPPIHASGTVSDGAQDWTFLHDGAGVVLITGWIDANTVEVDILGRLPSGQATPYWALQAYSWDVGWPRALAEVDSGDRLAFAASNAQPARLDLTRTSGWGPGYGDFKPGLGTGRVVDDDGVSLTVGGAGARVVWLLASTCLVVGTTESEFVVTGPSIDDPIVPNVPISRRLSEWGSADVEPVMLQGPPATILHVTRDRRAIRELKVSADQTTDQRELSLLAGHIYGRGVAQIVPQRSENLNWVRLDDGGLAVMAYHQEHQVLASTSQALPDGWTVESLASAPDGAGRDVILAVAHRLKGGSPQRRLWLLTARADGVFLDGAEFYAGTPVNSVGGLDHLEGETVTVTRNGALLGDRVVTGGVISDLNGATRVVAGLKLQRRFKSLPPDLQGIGSTYVRMYRPTEATVVLDCVHAWVGVVGTEARSLVTTRTADETVAPGLRRARAAVTLEGGADRDNRVVVEADQPFDLVIHALRSKGDVTA